MALRSCVACRVVRPRESLLRLALESKRRLVPDPDGSLPGRGAWVCPTQACVGQVAARPRVLGRALKQDPGPSAASGLVQAVRAQALAEVSRLLVRASRCGAIVSGTGNILRAEPGFLVLVHASDASACSVERARAHCEHALLAEIPLDRLALGRLLDRGPRAVLAVRAGTPGDELAYRLRWLRALG